MKVVKWNEGDGGWNEKGFILHCWRINTKGVGKRGKVEGVHWKEVIWKGKELKNLLNDH